MVKIMKGAGNQEENRSGSRQTSAGAHPHASACRGKKGFVYTLEVLLAIFIVSVSLASLFLQAPEPPQGSIAIIKRLGIETLEFMDAAGVLRNAVDTNNAAVIESELDARLPTTIASNATICFSSCSMAGLPVDRNVIIADYYVAGYRDVYHGRKVRIFMWLK